MNFLYQAGVDIQGKSPKGSINIHLAAIKGIQAWVEFYIKNGVPVDLRGHLNITPLLFAAQGGHLNIVKYLQNSGGYPSAVDKRGWTILHFAALGNVECLRYALSISPRIDVNAKTTIGCTPLHIVASSKRQTKAYVDTVGIASVLLQHGADVNAMSSNIIKKTINNSTKAFNITQWTPLHAATLYNDEPLIEFLVQNGADARIKDSSGQTPASYAATLGFKDAENTLRVAAKAQACVSCIIC